MLSAGAMGWTQAPPDPAVAADQQQPGMEVLASGPIHEAYAEPVSDRPQAGPVVPKQPPDPIEEMPPDQKPAGENVQWVPGYWAWSTDRNDFVWVSGIWRIPPPGQQWVPGHWDQAADGWQWSAGFWTVAGQDQLEYLPPPPEPVDAAPSEPAPTADSAFVPGNWVYAQTRYVWRPGYWVNYRPGWVWIPAHYVWTPVGYVFIEGYWDFELDRRGLLFAPVYFSRPLWRTANWFYRPWYVVSDDYLFGCLFVRRGFNSYYFGDYFDPAYRRLGFVDWLSFRFGRYGYDPLFSYYRWSYRGQPNYLTDLRSVYVGRYNGEIARPARTLVQQQTIIQNNVNITNVNLVKGVTALNQVNRSVVNLQPVPQPELTRLQQNIRTVRDVSRQRAQSETRLLSQGTAPAQSGRAQQPARVTLPKSVVASANPPAQHQPPAAPVAPRTSPRDALDTKGRPTYGAQPGGQPRPRTEPTTRPGTEAPRPQPGTKPGTEAPRPQPRTEPRPQPKAEPRPQPKAEPRPQPKAEPRPQPKAEPQPRPQPKAEPRPQPKAEPRPQPKAEPRPQPKAEPRPQPKAEPRPPVSQARPQPPARSAAPASRPDGHKRPA
jgi:hypothetical protein